MPEQKADLRSLAKHLSYPAQAYQEAQQAAVQGRKTMQALYFDGAKITLRNDYPLPLAYSGQSLIKVELAGMCNTDKEVAKGYKSGFRGILGHELIGTVIASEDEALLNRRVAVEINAACSTCQYCDSNLPNHCLNGRVLGMREQDGAFAEYLAFDNVLLHTLPDSLASDLAIFTEPLAAACELPALQHIQPQAKIAIVGDGKLALMICQVLSLLGNSITVFGRHEEKWDLFAPYALTKRQTPDDNEQFDYVVDACGGASGMQSALALVKRRGHIIVKSTYTGKVEVEFNQVVVNEISLHGNRCGPFRPAINLLDRGLIKLPPVKLYTLTEWEQAWEDPAFKVVFDFRQTSNGAASLSTATKQSHCIVQYPDH